MSKEDLEYIKKRLGACDLRITPEKINCAYDVRDVELKFEVHDDLLKEMFINTILARWGSANIDITKKNGITTIKTHTEALKSIIGTLFVNGKI